MPQANDAQMQQYANERVRVRAEQLRAVLLAMKDDKAAIDDIYDRAANGAAWNDSRTDGPPSLLSSSDMLTYNSYITALIPNIEDAANWAVILSACVRPVGA